jgi:hypothetical protein
MSSTGTEQATRRTPIHEDFYVFVDKPCPKCKCWYSSTTEAFAVNVGCKCDCHAAPSKPVKQTEREFRRKKSK